MYKEPVSDLANAYWQIEDARNKISDLLPSFELGRRERVKEFLGAIQAAVLDFEDITYQVWTPLIHDRDHPKLPILLDAVGIIESTLTGLVENSLDNPIEVTKFTATSTALIEKFWGRDIKTETSLGHTKPLDAVRVIESLCNQMGLVSDLMVEGDPYKLPLSAFVQEMGVAIQAFYTTH